MPPSPAALAAPPLCKGMQNDRINGYTKSGPSAIRSLNNRFCRIRGQWHSKQCSFLAEDKPGCKQRCPSCRTTNSNIRKDRFPELFPEQCPIVQADESPSAVSHSPQSNGGSSVGSSPPGSDIVPSPGSQGNERTIPDLILPTSKLCV